MISPPSTASLSSPIDGKREREGWRKREGWREREKEGLSLLLGAARSEQRGRPRCAAAP